LPDDLAPADLTLERALQLLKAKAQGPKSLGVDPKTAQQVYVMHGRFGAYVQLGETPEDRDAEKPRRASLGRDFTEDTITLDVALRLLSLPRELGHGDDGEAILANVGRFGPYVKHGSEFRSLEESDDVYTISFERAKELLAQPKKSMRRARQAPKELKALGKHPDSGADVKILDGRYGPYVTDGTTNASVPKGTQVEAVTMSAAVELLKAREGMGGKKARRAKTAKAASKTTKAAAKPRKRTA
jgi:DNA topoisomerase-1